jgi:hypothetical protein
VVVQPIVDDDVPHGRLARRFGTGTPGAAINNGEQGLAPADLGGNTA